ncbi:MAG: hypothetical protein K6G80_08040, partial [Treponema sp.]|nr:hypothetical protein [Treponema sp.]
KENDWKYSLASYALGATVVKCSDGDVDLILFMTDVSNIKGAASDSSTFDQTVSGSGSETEPLIFSPSVDKIQIPLKTELTFTCDTTAANDICTVDAGTAVITLTLADNARSEKAGETGIIRILGSDNSHVIPVYVKVPAKTVSATALSSLTEEEYEAVKIVTLDSTEGMEKILDLANGGKTFEGKTITLEADVEMPVGKYFVNAFSGTLNGNGKTISGLSGVNALFQKIDTNGVVENLTLRGSSTEAGFAYMVNGAVKNCISEVTVNATSGYAGGICGMTGSAAVIDSCINRGPITVSDAKYYVGGIVGFGNTLIRNCINEGEINAETSDHVGGIVGKQIYTGIENCYNKGAVSGNSDVGGICGIITAANGSRPYITNCYSTGTVTGKEAGTTTIGAILGQAEDDSDTVVSATYVYALTGAADRAIGAHSGDASADSAQLLSASEFATLYTSLNSWVTANTTSSTEPEYKSWKAGSDGYPTFAD